MSTKIFGLFIGIFCLVNMVKAQDITIASPDFITCSATFNDTNPIGQYGNNEDETITVCADGDPIINFYFIGFDIGEGDVLEIFDGPDVGSPLIGSYTGTDIVNENIFSTNPEACLTLHWTSDDSGVGDFGAIVTCGPPCEHPIIDGAIVGDSGNPLLLCVGEEFTIDASATQFMNDAILESFTWNFGDETLNTTSWPQITYSYDEPGAYVVSLVVIDSTDCPSLNLLDQIVYVSTTPTFTTGTDPALICVEGESQIVGEVTATPYTNQPVVDFGDGVYIPDNQGCFTDTIQIAGYTAGAAITSESDIESLYASLEHTYLTDITIAFICPNGSILSVYSQQGVCGDIDLGIPIPADDGAPGEGLVYSWTPSVTSPTLAEACSDANFTFDDSGDSGDNLIEGEYASEDPWSNFIGCPYNGPWIIQVCDIVGADDGWIFQWGVNFSPESGATPLSFTPTFGESCDSTYWSGNNITSTDALCDSAWVSPFVSGVQTYTYSATDNFGCTYTASVEVNVIPEPVANAGADVYYCGQDVQLNGSVDNPVQGQQYIYSWESVDMVNNASLEDPFFTMDIDTITRVFLTTYWSQDENCSSMDSVDVLLPLLPNVGTLTNIFPCTNELPYTLYSASQDQAFVTYQWTYLGGTEPVDFGTDPSVTSDLSGNFLLVLTEPNCGLTVQQNIQVTPQACVIFVPNIMSPNGDGENDTFLIDGINNYNGSTVQVYNRWGNLIFEDLDYNGKWGAVDVAEGTYYYILGVNKPEGMEYRSGSLTIVR